MSGSNSKSGRCRHVGEDGKRCGAPTEFVRESGWCRNHDPDPEVRAEVMRASRRGGETTARKHRRPKLQPGELPPLTDAKSAKQWCEISARAVAEGRLSASQGQTTARLLNEWTRSHDLVLREERLRELEREVERLRAARGSEAVQ